MRNPELFMLLSGLQEHIDREQWDAVRNIVSDTLWAVADKDWKEMNKERMFGAAKSRD
jgi:hypothetical protein